jgi:hypothetical protein
MGGMSGDEMDYIHIRNLEKYHPGYKDRTLQWAKIYFKMAQGDPDCDLIENEIDWGRLIKIILLELQAQKPLPNSNLYWSKKGFDVENRPMALTLQMLHNFIEIKRECYIDKDKYSKEEYKEEQDKDTPSATKVALDKIYQDGLNIYSLINKLKKESKVGAEIPEVVLLAVCESYWKSKPKIKEDWAWFQRVLVAEWQKYNAEQNVKEGEAWKKQGMAQSIKDILGVK